MPSGRLLLPLLGSWLSISTRGAATAHPPQAWDPVRWGLGKYPQSSQKRRVGPKMGFQLLAGASTQLALNKDLFTAIWE